MAARLQPPASARRSVAALARANEQAGEPWQALLRQPRSPASEPESAGEATPGSGIQPRAPSWNGSRPVSAACRGAGAAAAAAGKK